jgi:hypothetical protein
MKKPPPAPPDWPEWKGLAAALWPAAVMIAYLALVALPVLAPLFLR